MWGSFAAFCALHLYLDFAVGNIFRLFSAFAIAEYAKLNEKRGEGEGGDLAGVRLTCCLDVA